MHVSIRVAQTLRVCLHFGPVQPSATTLPRAPQCAPRREDWLIRTILSRPVEGIKTNSTRWSVRVIIVVEGPNTSHTRRRMIRTILRRNKYSDQYLALCSVLFTTAIITHSPIPPYGPCPFYSYSTFGFGGGRSLVPSITAIFRNSSNNADIAAVLRHVPTNVFMNVCCRGVDVTLPLVYTFWFIVFSLATARQSLPSQLFRILKQYCDMCLQPRVCPVASCDSPNTAARTASACCLLQHLLL